MKRLRVRIALLVILAIVAWFGLRQYEAAWLATPLPALQQPVVYQLPAGASLSAVADSLENSWMAGPAPGLGLVCEVDRCRDPDQGR